MTVAGTRAEAVIHLRSLVDLAGDDPERALRQLDLGALAFLGGDATDEGTAASGSVVGTGTAASPGVGVGMLHVDAGAALEAIDRGEDVVFAAERTTPADEPVLRQARAVVTTAGGMASHAAVLARAHELPAVCGVHGVAVTEAGLVGRAGVEVPIGATLTVDGTRGVVLRAAVAVERMPDDVRAVVEALSAAAAVVVGRAGVAVLANADTAEQAVRGLAAGAGGIGLCRTEHQLDGAGWAQVGALLATEAGSAAEGAALVDLEVRWSDATAALFEAVGDRPLSVRLLDAPEDEFVAPSDQAAGATLGVRGIGQAIARPALLGAQLRALSSAVGRRRATGGVTDLRILLPFVTSEDEVATVVPAVRAALPGIAVGAMIETPPAARVAGALASHVSFFAVGSNDLTQLALGRSRDVAPPGGDRAADPFARLDIDGVGRLVRRAIVEARAIRPGFPVSVCGEHASDPGSIAAYLAMGVTAFSVVPSLVPATRLAVAHALLTTR